MLLGIHQAVFFLPWHRWFVLQYENLLREIDCRITVPYWASAEEANDALASDTWNSGDHGLGGNGSGSSNCVQDGPFRAEVMISMTGELRQQTAENNRAVDFVVKFYTTS